VDTNLTVYSHGLVGEVGALITIKDSTSYIAFFILDSSLKQKKVVTVILASVALIRPLELAHVTFRIIFAMGFSVHNGIPS